MCDDRKPTIIDVNTSEGSVRLEGIYEDVRPLVQTTVEAANEALKVVANLIGLPADFMNFHLERFRDRYRKGVESIPVEFRERPSFRLTCTVIREVSLSRDEPDFQEMFAQLLTNGSDSRCKSKVHPGFASTITQLTRNDADAVRRLYRRGGACYLKFLPDVVGSEGRDSPIMGNLLRLGLIEWLYEPIDKGVSASRLANNYKRELSHSLRMSRHVNPGTSSVPVAGFERAIENLSLRILTLMQQEKSPVAVGMTRFGHQFAAACLSDSDDVNSGPSE